MENKIITKFKIFTISDYEKEEKYLREMANKGYHLKSVSFPGFYKFNIGEPKDVVYRLDYSSYNKEDKENYVKMFQDYGWEHLWNFFGWEYFRKEGKDANIEIFSDDESRLGIIKKVFFSRLLPIIILFIVTFLFELEYMFTVENLVLRIVYILVFLLYVYMITYTGYGLYKLNKKYKN